jgi:F0F1-type ATP synthase assembly protein I
MLRSSRIESKMYKRRMLLQQKALSIASSSLFSFSLPFGQYLPTMRFTSIILATLVGVVAASPIAKSSVIAAVEKRVSTYPTLDPDILRQDHS